MKRSAFLLSLCAVLILTAVMYRLQSSAPSLPAVSPAAQADDRPLYIVRADTGLLAIYPYGSDSASEITDIRLSSLRAYDQELIRRGFPLYTEQELISFLEDFGS